MGGITSYFGNNPSVFGVAGGAFSAWLGIVVILFIIWSFIWKGLALWKSARSGSKVWFIILLLVNTVGILEILYIYVFSKKSSPSAQS